MFSRADLDTFHVSERIWQNTNYIASICNAELQYHQSLLPKFKTPNNQPSKDYLYEMLQQNLKQLNLSQASLQRYAKRLNHEYEIITRMGFEDYF